MKYIALALSLLTASSFAQTKIPTSVSSQVPAGWTVKEVIKGQLNNDTKQDMVVVVENKNTEEIPRKIMIFFADDKNYKLSGTSDLAVFCEKCGGIFGDPYNGVQIDKKKIIINNYGGSAWRWTDDFTFAYSRIDQQWQLVKIEKSSFHSSNPEKVKYTTKLPKEFGKISLENFDPEKF